MDWIDLARGKDRWWVLVNAVMNLWVIIIIIVIVIIVVRFRLSLVDFIVDLWIYCF
jgi:hypothetical protein